MEPIILETEVTKSKKDNIYCLFIKLNDKTFGVEDDNYNIDYDDAGNKKVTIELMIGTSCSDEYIGIVTFDVTDIWEQYEYPHYDIRKNKEELYIYFYEYPYEEDEVEMVDLKVDYLGYIEAKETK
jgi:hypothetical protein